MNATFKTIMLWMSLLVVIFLAWHFAQIQKKETSLKFSEFMTQVEAGNIQEVTVTGNEIKGKTQPARRSAPTRPRTTTSTWTRSWPRRSQVNVERDQTPAWANILITWAPLLLILGFWIFFMRQMQSGGNKALSFGKSKAKLLATQQKKVTFKDVAGVDEAKEELQEIIEFLREPQKFQKLGGRIPKGVLLMGPPGPARRCSRARSPARPTCRSSRSRAPTSSRCSWASAPAACATCSSRARRTRPASSSSTRSTPSAAIAAPASAAATTSASRR